MVRRTTTLSLDLFEARRRLIEMRSKYSGNRRIAPMINQLLVRLAHLSEPENEKHEEHLRKMIAATVERIERIVSLG
jgi:hypothetical protein